MSSFISCIRDINVAIKQKTIIKDVFIYFLFLFLTIVSYTYSFFFYPKGRYPVVI